MAEDLYYPPLDTKTIKSLPIVRELAAEHASYFLSAPYPMEVQTILQDLFKKKEVIAEERPENDDRDNWEFLYEESKHLYLSLKGASAGNLETSDKMAYFRTATALLEKLLSMQERSNNLKQVSDFYALVLEIMESELSGDQRTRVMQRLSDATKG
jgi:hypothetical protein